ncbi:MAG TPA: hypothetical protein DEQ61_16260 [Streptomyces sp.]|nr:hypothetical protein [Streptomyces sp.]
MLRTLEFASATAEPSGVAPQAAIQLALEAFALVAPFGLFAVSWAAPLGLATPMQASTMARAYRGTRLFDIVMSLPLRSSFAL